MYFISGRVFSFEDNRTCFSGFAWSTKTLVHVNFERAQSNAACFAVFLLVPFLSATSTKSIILKNFVLLA
jgi:hypothetical protein